MTNNKPKVKINFGALKLLGALLLLLPGLARAQFINVSGPDELKKEYLFPISSYQESGSPVNKLGAECDQFAGWDSASNIYKDYGACSDLPSTGEIVKLAFNNSILTTTKAKFSYKFTVPTQGDYIFKITTTNDRDNFSKLTKQQIDYILSKTYTDLNGLLGYLGEGITQGDLSLIGTGDTQLYQLFKNMVFSVYVDDESSPKKGFLFVKNTDPSNLQEGSIRLGNLLPGEHTIYLHFLSDYYYDFSTAWDSGTCQGNGDWNHQICSMNDPTACLSSIPAKCDSATKHCLGGPNNGNSCKVATEAVDCPPALVPFNCVTNVCSGGPYKGSCGSDADCPPALSVCQGVCSGGTNQNNSCTTDSNCPPATTVCTNDVCSGGPKKGEPCTVATEATDCPLSVCANNVCLGGPNQNKNCITAGDCPLYEPGKCISSLADIYDEFDNANLNIPTCEGGDNDGKKCAVASDCPSGNCKKLRTLDVNPIIYSTAINTVTQADDVVGIRIYTNNEHKDTQTWYQDNVVNASPSVEDLNVDGYSGIRDDRTVYVNAVNLKELPKVCQGTSTSCVSDGDCAGGISCITPKQFFTNIYVMAYNQNAPPTTVNIFNQMLDNWKFNTNITPDVKEKLLRDLQRIMDLKKIGELLDTYYAGHGKYPDLEAGSFVKTHAISTWPSWQATLGNELGSALPVDPLNLMATEKRGTYNCQSDDPTEKAGCVNFCTRDAQGNPLTGCPLNSQCLDDQYCSICPAPYDAQTCWDTLNAKFVFGTHHDCPDKALLNGSFNLGGTNCNYDGAYVYQYTALEKGKKKLLNYRLEYQEQNVCSPGQCYFDNGDNDPTNDCYNPGACLANCDTSGQNCGFCSGMAAPPAGDTFKVWPGYSGDDIQAFIRQPDRSSDWEDLGHSQFGGSSILKSLNAGNYELKIVYYSNLDSDTPNTGAAGFEYLDTLNRSNFKFTYDGTSSCRDEIHQTTDPVGYSKMSCFLTSQECTLIPSISCTNAHPGSVIISFTVPCTENGGTWTDQTKYKNTYCYLGDWHKSCGDGFVQNQCGELCDPNLTLPEGESWCDQQYGAQDWYNESKIKLQCSADCSLVGVNGVPPAYSPDVTQLSCGGYCGDQIRQTQYKEQCDEGPDAGAVKRPDQQGIGGISEAAQYFCTGNSGGKPSVSNGSDCDVVAGWDTAYYYCTTTGNIVATLPAAPSGLTATAASDTSINLGWTDNSDNETGFRIQRKEGTGGTYALIKILNAGVTSYNDTGLSSSTTYYYQVLATNAGGNSAWSNEASAQTQNPPSPDKEITAFSFAGLTPVVNGTISGTTITLTVPFSTSRTNLVATFTTTGASVKIGTATQTSGVTQNDFTSSKIYIVTAADNTTKNYTVTVSVALNTDKEITAFSFASLSPVVNGTISGTTITLTVPFGTSRNPLTATFTTTGASVKIGGTLQISGTTANNFTSAKTYTVTAADTSTKNYTVTVNVAPNTAKEITAFSFAGLSPVVNGTITGTTITLTVPFGTSRNPLTATFTTTGASVKIGTATQTSGVTQNDFTSSKTYIVTAADTSTKNYTVTVNVAAPPPAPAAPSGLTAVKGSNALINLTWTDNSNNEDGFKIKRGIVSGTYDPTPIGTVGAGVTTYQNVGLQPDTYYYYRVYAYNAGGPSGDSNEANAKTDAAPLAPSYLVLSSSSASSLTMHWTDNSSVPNEDHFKIERRPNITNSLFNFSDTAAQNATTYTNTGLAASTSYCYRVSAVSSGGQSIGYSNEICPTTASLQGMPDAAPSNLTATAMSSKQINILWTDASSTGHKATSWEVWRGTDGVNYVNQSTNFDLILYHVDHNLDPSTPYYYKVKPCNVTGCYANYSNVASTTTSLAPVAAPSAPTGLALNSPYMPGTSYVTLKWIDTSSNELGFKVERKTTGAWTEITTSGGNAVWAGGTYYNNNGLLWNTTYTYRVYAYNQIPPVGPQLYSNEISVTTSAQPITPIAPTGLSSAVTTSPLRINLTWTDNTPSPGYTPDNEVNFKIERGSGTVAGDMGFAALAAVLAGTTTYSDTTVLANTAYKYRVYAVNQSVNASGYSNNTCIKTDGTACLVTLNNKNLTPNLFAYGKSMLKAAYQWTKNEIKLMADQVKNSSVWENLAQFALNNLTHTAKAILPSGGIPPGGSPWITNYPDHDTGPGIMSLGGFKVGYKFNVKRPGTYSFTISSANSGDDISQLTNEQIDYLMELKRNQPGLFLYTLTEDGGLHIPEYGDITSDNSLKYSLLRSFIYSVYVDDDSAGTSPIGFIILPATNQDKKQEGTISLGNLSDGDHTIYLHFVADHFYLPFGDLVGAGTITLPDYVNGFTNVDSNNDGNLDINPILFSATLFSPEFNIGSCKTYGGWCGDGVLQLDYGEQCEINNYIKPSAAATANLVRNPSFEKIFSPWQFSGDSNSHAYLDDSQAFAGNYSLNVVDNTKGGATKYYLSQFGNIQYKTSYKVSLRIKDTGPDGPNINSVALQLGDSKAEGGWYDDLISGNFVKNGAVNDWDLYEITSSHDAIPSPASDLVWKEPAYKFRLIFNLNTANRTNFYLDDIKIVSGLNPGETDGHIQYQCGNDPVSGKICQFKGGFCGDGITQDGKNGTVRSGENCDDRVGLNCSTLGSKDECGLGGTCGTCTSGDQAKIGGSCGSNADCGATGACALICQSNTCNDVCKSTYCGDGIVQSPNSQGVNEICDPEKDRYCSADCLHIKMGGACDITRPCATTLSCSIRNYGDLITSEKCLGARGSKGCRANGDCILGYYCDTKTSQCLSEISTYLQYHPEEITPLDLSLPLPKGSVTYNVNNSVCPTLTPLSTADKQNYVLDSCTNILWNAADNISRPNWTYDEAIAAGCGQTSRLPTIAELYSLVQQTNQEQIFYADKDILKLCPLNCTYGGKNLCSGCSDPNYLYWSSTCLEKSKTCNTGLTGQACQTDDDCLVGGPGTGTCTENSKTCSAGLIGQACQTDDDCLVGGPGTGTCSEPYKCSKAAAINFRYGSIEASPTLDTSIQSAAKFKVRCLRQTQCGNANIDPGEQCEFYQAFKCDNGQACAKDSDCPFSTCVSSTCADTGAACTVDSDCPGSCKFDKLIEQAITKQKCSDFGYDTGFLHCDPTSCTYRYDNCLYNSQVDSSCADICKKKGLDCLSVGLNTRLADDFFDPNASPAPEFSIADDFQMMDKDAGGNCFLQQIPGSSKTDYCAYRLTNRQGSCRDTQTGAQMPFSSQYTFCNCDEK